MPVLKTHLLETDPRLRTTQGSVLVNHFVRDHDAFTFPPKRYDAFRYRITTLENGLGEPLTILFESKTAMPGEDRAGLLSLRVTWIELFDRILILHMKNRPERYDGAWTVFTGEAPRRDLDIHLGKPQTTWRPLQIGRKSHLYGWNETGIAFERNHDKTVPALFIPKNGELRVTTLADVRARERLAPSPASR